MPRNFKRKPEFDPLSVSEKKTFLLKKHTSRLSLRQVAVKGLSKSTIHRLLKSNSVSDVTRSFKKTCHNRQVFIEQEECELTNYLIVAQKLNHGLTPSDTIKLANEKVVIAADSSSRRNGTVVRRKTNHQVTVVTEPGGSLKGHR